MIDDPATQVAFTAVFVLLCVYSVVRIVIDRSRTFALVAHVLQALMAADMAVMPWAWWTQIPFVPQVILFSTATVWCAALAVLQIARWLPRRHWGGHGPWHSVGHLLMMLAMVWMVAVMAPLLTAEPSSTPASTGHAHAALFGWSALGGVALTAALTACGVLLVVELVHGLRGGTRTWFGHIGDLASGAAMSLGMAAMCWWMLTV